MNSGFKYSLIIPVYGNEENIGHLLEALTGLHQLVGDGLEIIFVVDCSPDHSWVLLHKALPSQSFPSQLVLLSRNFGSFLAIRTGFEYVRGDYVAVMAADLQEPVELMADFFFSLEGDEADVVIGKRLARQDPRLSSLFSRLYWRLYRKFVLPGVPPGGVDVFGCNRKAMETLLTFKEHNSSLLAQLFWIGFRRKTIAYQRRKREIGTSQWSVAKKVQYMLDSIFSFSALPIQLLLWGGVLFAGLSGLLGVITITANLLGYVPVSGYTTIVILIVFSFSVLMMTQGIIGSYLWRCFENSKQRPLSIIQSHEAWGGDKMSRKKKEATCNND